MNDLEDRLRELCHSQVGHHINASLKLIEDEENISKVAFVAHALWMLVEVAGERRRELTHE